MENHGRPASPTAGAAGYLLKMLRGAVIVLILGFKPRECYVPTELLSLLAMVVKALLMSLATVDIPKVAASAIRAASRAYSIRSCPESSFPSSATYFA